MLAEGGTESGHSVTSAPGPSPSPPLEAGPGRPPRDPSSSTDPPGSLTLRAAEDDIAFVGRRQAHLCCSARAVVDASAGSGGLSLRIDPWHHYDLELSAGDLSVVAQIGSIRNT